MWCFPKTATGSGEQGGCCRGGEPILPGTFKEMHGGGADGTTGVEDDFARRGSKNIGAGAACAERSYAHVEASGQRIWNLHRWLRRRSRPRSGQSDGARRVTLAIRGSADGQVEILQLSPV